LGIHGEPFSRRTLARALAAAEASDWKTSAQEFVALCRSSGADSNLWQKAAAALLMAGDTSGYQQHCRAMIDRFAATDSLYSHERVIKTCLLQPDAVDRSRLPLGSVASAFAFETIPANLDAWASFALGLAAYRSGDWDRTLEWSDRSSKNATPALRTLGLLISAMAKHRLGD